MPTATPRSTWVAEIPRGAMNSAMVISNLFIRIDVSAKCTRAASFKSCIWRCPADWTVNR